MKKVLLVVAVFFATSVSANDYLNALKEYAVNDTIKISVQDIAKLIEANPSMEITRKPHLGECEWNDKQGEIMSRRIVNSAIQITNDSLYIGESTGARFIYTILTDEPINGPYWIMDEDINNTNIDLIVSTLDYIFKDTMDINHSVLSDVSFVRHSNYTTPTYGDIIIFNVGKNQLHAVVCKEDNEIIHDTGSGIEIESIDNYFSRYEIVRWYRPCAEFAKVNQSLKTVDVISSILKALSK